METVNNQERLLRLKVFLRKARIWNGLKLFYVIASLEMYMNMPSQVEQTLCFWTEPLTSLCSNVLKKRGLRRSQYMKTQHRHKFLRV